MPKRSSTLIVMRNTNIKKRYNELTTKNPKWRHDALIDSLQLEFYLSVRTISAILNNEGTYGKTA